MRYQLSCPVWVRKIVWRKKKTCFEGVTQLCIKYLPSFIRKERHFEYSCCYFPKLESYLSFYSIEYFRLFNDGCELFSFMLSWINLPCLFTVCFGQFMNSKYEYFGSLLLKYFRLFKFPLTWTPKMSPLGKLLQTVKVTLYFIFKLHFLPGIW